MEQQEKNYFNGKREFEMRGQHLWEKKGSSSSCRQCGQFIKNGEPYYLVLTNAPDCRKDFPKESNFIIHKSDFDTMVEATGSESKAVCNILSYKRPRAKNGTKVDEEIVERFKAISRRRGFDITKETKNLITFKPKRRDPLNFTFDKRFHNIEYIGRGLNGLFDGIFLNEFKSRIREELFDTAPGYRANDAIKKATEQVAEWMR
jgi:hypothetical protein